MSESYPCPHCKPFVPFRNKESLFMHLQREHNLNATDAIQITEMIDPDTKVELNKNIDLGE